METGAGMKDKSWPSRTTDHDRLYKKIALAVLALSLIVRLGFAWQPFKFQIEKGALMDDAFYSLAVARNIALGTGLTCDGIHRTNGFQPLYVFLMVPVYRLMPDDKITPVYVAITILALAGVAGGWFMYRIASRRWGPGAGLFALLLFCFSPYAIENCTNGLETSLAALFWMIAIELYLGKIRPDGGSLRARLGLGVVLALLVFTRIDGGILAVAIALDWLFRPIEGAPDMKRRVRMITEIAITALVLYAPWAIYNQVSFGSVMPVSGGAVRYISQMFGGWELSVPVPEFEPGHVPFSFYLGKFIYSVGALVRGNIFFPATPVVFLLGRLGTFLHVPELGAWWLWLAVMMGGFALARWVEREMDVLFIAIGLTLIAYSAYVFAHWFFYRYFYPIELCLLLLSAAVFKFMMERIAARARVPALIVIALVFAFIFYKSGKVIYGHTTDDKIVTYYSLAMQINENLPEDARVGAFQSGAIGYFADRTVINLDGAVNGDALKAMKEKRMMDYIIGQEIDYVMDYTVIIRALLFRTIDKEDMRYLEPLTGSRSKIQMFRVRRPRP